MLASKVWSKVGVDSRCRQYDCICTLRLCRYGVSHREGCIYTPLLVSESHTVYIWRSDAVIPPCEIPTPHAYGQLRGVPPKPDIDMRGYGLVWHDCQMGISSNASRFSPSGELNLRFGGHFRPIVS